MSGSEEKLLRREHGRRRVYIFVTAWLLLSVGGIINEESDMFLHALDEYAILTLVIIAAILFFFWRKKQSLSDLRKQHNIIWILFLVALAFKIYAIFVEAGDPTDFGNEIPIFILLILTLVNRFA